MSALREVLAKFVVDFDKSELKSGVDAIENGIGSLKRFASALGVGLSLGALKDFVVGVTEEVVALDRQSKALRIGVTDLQEWREAALVAGSSSDALSGALEDLSKRSAQPATKSLARMADRLAAIKDPTRRAAMGTALLGSNYLELEPLLAKGSKGIQGFIDRSRELGTVLGKESVEAAKENRRHIGELNVVYKGLRNTLAAAVLPVAVKALKEMVPIALAIKELAKHTKLFEAAAMLLGTRGLFLMVGRLGGFAGMLKKVLPLMKGIGRALFTWVVPLLILEDFLVFLKGGKSAFGEVLDKIFGKGAAEKVRTAINAMLGGWDQLLEYAKAVWGSIEYAVKIAVGELGFAFINLGSIVADIFAKIWNGIIDGAKWTVRQLGAAADAVGAKDTAKSLTEFEKSMDSAKGSADWSDQVVKDRERWRLKVAEEGDAIGDNWNRMLSASKEGRKALFDPTSAKAADTPGKLTLDPITIAASPKKAGGVVNNHSNVSVNVSVPPGTPETMARRTAKATADAVKKNNLATRAALVPGQG